MKNRLHLFFPENDIALVRDMANYTPPVAAVRLRRSGESLPLWYGDRGDRFVASGIDAAWLDSINRTFGMDMDVFDYRPDAYTPVPWGWSKASREAFVRLGYELSELPDDEAIEKMRQLSHRRVASEIAKRLIAVCQADSIAPAALELKSEDDVRAFVAATGDCILKLPWSSSGRGLMAIDSSNLESRMPMIRGMLRNQGSVMGEKHYDKAVDFAMLFSMDQGRCSYEGLSLFTTASLGAYEGNILAPQQEIEQTIKDTVDSSAFDAVRSALPGILSDIIGDAYSGPLGIDMIGVKGEKFSLAPAIEMNLRMTMGHLCLQFYKRYAADGSRGHFGIGTERKPDDFRAFDGRMRSGYLNLVAPGGAFSFFVELA